MQSQVMIHIDKCFDSVTSFFAILPWKANFHALWQTCKDQKYEKNNKIQPDKQLLLCAKSNLYSQILNIVYMHVKYQRLHQSGKRANIRHNIVWENVTYNERLSNQPGHVILEEFSFAYSIRNGPFNDDNKPSILFWYLTCLLTWKLTYSEYYHNSIGQP